MARGGGAVLLALLLAALAGLALAPNVAQHTSSNTDTTSGAGPVEIVLDERSAKIVTGTPKSGAIVFSTTQQALVAYVKPEGLIPASRVEVEARVMCTLTGAGPMAKVGVTLGNKDGLGLFVLATPFDFVLAANAFGSYGVTYSAAENPSGKWHTVKAVFTPRNDNAANVTLYVDGVKVKDGVTLVNDFAGALHRLPYWAYTFAVTANTGGNPCSLDYAKAVIYPGGGG